MEVPMPDPQGVPGSHSGRVLSGAVAGGEEALLQMVHRHPADVEARLALARFYLGHGRTAEALPHLDEVLRLRPDWPDGHYELGLSLAALGQSDRALRAYRQVLALAPDHAEALVNLGVTLAQRGQMVEAEHHLRRAAEVRPDFARAHHNLGIALAQQGRGDEAITSIRRAIATDPSYAEAHATLGNLLADLGRRDEAVAAYREAIRLRPGYPEALSDLGWALTQMGRCAEAVVLLRQATHLRPSFVDAHNNLGLALADLGCHDEAMACYEEALRLDPHHAPALANLGSACRETGRLEEAIAWYEHALRLEPNSPSTHWNLGLACLHRGDFERGWQEYEWRWRKPRAGLRPFREPCWDGGPLAGRTFLLWCEQGLGDVLQFVRYAPLLKARGARVVLECPGLLVPLLRTLPGVDQFVAEGEPLPPFDVHVPLLSLPQRLGTTLATVPAEVPYLSADAALVARWRPRLEAASGFRVGICWQGNPHHKWDRHRSVPLHRFLPLAEIQGVRLVSLQHGPGVEQLRAACGRIAVLDLSEARDRSAGAFQDDAAMIAGLDLVITVDTAIAHLAGALGAPVWVALAKVVDWRWLHERDDSPWYPTMRLFRQRRLGDWEPVFERMAEALRRLVASRHSGGVVRVPISPGELLDKITILRIKSERIAEPARLAHVRGELAGLEEARERCLPADAELARLTAELKAVNEVLWEVEDAIRLCEREGDFGPRFVELARSVYRRNDERASLKRRINERLQASFSEQKAYPEYA
jgi:tetratricopeptide (TPR) repeat protein